MADLNGRKIGGAQRRVPSPLLGRGQGEGLNRLIAVLLVVVLPGSLGMAADGNQKTRPSQAQSQLDLPPPDPQQVSVKSRWAYSAEENRPAASWLLERARISGAESGALDKLVQRWPDVTLELLRESVAGETDFSPLLTIAQTYDRVFASEPGAGWAIVLTTSESRRASNNRFRKIRVEMLGLFQSGRFQEAAKIDPVAALPDDAPFALRTEGLRLAGLAALLNDKPDRAAELFARAVVAAARGPRHARFEAGLLLSEAERRRGRAAAGIAAWKAAVVSAADVRDPGLWERAILAKTGGVDWPEEAAIAGANEPNFAAADTSDVLIGIGKMRLSRGAPQPALLAFSAAEAETAVAGKKSLARLYRVQSMIALQQAASALPMLEALVKSADPLIARRAQAIEGDVLCRVLNDRQHGIFIMREALEHSDLSDWPGRTRLLANLGLYLILEGHEDEGLRFLHQTQARFESEAQWEDLADSLKNEAACLRLSNKREIADSVQKHADEVCRKADLPIEVLVAKTSRK